jgi:Zn-dependent protease
MFGNVDLVQTVYLLVALVISISFHEFFHAWLAVELGDSTPRQNGRLTLNPVAHFEPVGALMIVFLAISGWGIGWGKPVIVNPYNFRMDQRIGMGITAVAGPFSNLLLAAVAAIPIRLGMAMPDPLFTFFFIMVLVNVSLAIFNLIPLPPLDGFDVVQAVLTAIRTPWSRNLNDRLDRLAAYGPLVLFALLAIGWILPIDPIGLLMGGPVNSILGLLLG